MNRLAIAMLLLGPAGCKVVDAPEAFEDLAVFGLVHFQDEPEFPEAAVAGLLPLADELSAELVEGYRVAALDEEDLVEAGVDSTVEVPIVGMSVAVSMQHDLDEVTWAWSWPDMRDVLGTTVEFEITDEDGDRDCFLAHDCETYSYDATRTNDLGFFGTSAQTVRREFRWTVDPEDNPVLTMRDLVPDPADVSVSFLKIDQQYDYAVMAERDGGTLRVEAIWIEARVIGVDVPDYFALNAAVNGIQTTAEEIDAFIDANGESAP